MVCPTSGRIGRPGNDRERVRDLAADVRVRLAVGGGLQQITAGRIPNLPDGPGSVPAHQRLVVRERTPEGRQVSGAPDVPQRNGRVAEQAPALGAPDGRASISFAEGRVIQGQ